MQAVAILLVASTMGGEFPTNPNANTLRLPPPMVRASAPTKARSLLDEAMRASDSAASDAAASARNGANYLKNKVRNGVSLAASELRLDAPTSRVAQAQYQRDGLPLRPVDGMTGPGSRAAGSDPTAAYGGRMQSVPRSGTMPTAPSLGPLPTTAKRTAATPGYRPVRGYGSEANNTTSNTTSVQPPYRPTRVPTTQNTLPVATPPVERTYGSSSPLANNNNNSSLLDLPPSNPVAAPTNTGSQYRPNANPNPALEQPRTRTTPAVVPPIGGLATQPTVPTTTYRAPTETPTTVTTNTNRSYRTNDTRESEGSYIMTLLALFASVGLNIYLAWTAYDTYNRYQDLVADMKTTGPRRERRRERRRFVEPAASTASY